MKLPENIEKVLEGKEYKTDSIGKSDSQVMIFDDSVLKIARYSRENQEKVQMFRWIAGRLPVPEVLCFEEDENFQYLLMSKMPGVMSCNEYYMTRPDLLLSLLADAIKMLWAVDISGCNRDCGFYGGKVYPGIHPEVLFEHLGIEPDWDKIRYFILLDELF